MISGQCAHVEHGEKGHRSFALVEAEDEVVPNTLVVDLGLVAVVIDRLLEVWDRVNIDVERVDGGNNEEAFVVFEQLDVPVMIT